MSVKFCITSGAVPGNLTCGMDVPTGVEEKPVRLDAMGVGPRYVTYSTKCFQKLIKTFEKMPDDDTNIWQCRIVVNLAPVESVFCISFIPADPYSPQTLLIMRMRDLNQTAESYPVYCCDFSAYKFMLPQERVDQIFDISKLSIPQTIEQFDASLIPIFEKVLVYLSREKKLRGMALTLTNQDNTLKTYVWLKG